MDSIAQFSPSSINIPNPKRMDFLDISDHDLIESLTQTVHSNNSDFKNQFFDNLGSSKSINYLEGSGLSNDSSFMNNMNSNLSMGLSLTPELPPSENLLLPKLLPIPLKENSQIVPLINASGVEDPVWSPSNDISIEDLHITSSKSEGRFSAAPGSETSVAFPNSSHNMNSLWHKSNSTGDLASFGTNSLNLASKQPAAWNSQPPGLLPTSRSSNSIPYLSMGLLSGSDRPLSVPANLNMLGSSNEDLFSGFKQRPQSIGRSGSSSQLQSPSFSGDLSNGGQFNGGSSMNFGGSLSFNTSADPLSIRLGTHSQSSSNLLGGSAMFPYSQDQAQSVTDSCWPKPVRHTLQNSNLNSNNSNNNGMDTIFSPTSIARPQSASADGSISSPFEHQRKTFTPTKAPSPSPKLQINNVDERAVENVVANNCHQILMDAGEHSLKAVELANTLRARVGTEVLALVRERWGGLLSLLERHPDRFRVERVPKNDRVVLVDPSKPITSTLSAVKSRGREDSSDSLDPAEAMNDSNSADHQTASRCLHVGNVPSTYTEVQLMKEFEKYGQLDGLKLINQKNGMRRFAFITYKSVDQAITARHCLSKVHPWKSAISFAHKDLMQRMSGMGPASRQFDGHRSNGYGNNHNMQGNYPYQQQQQYPPHMQRGHHNQQQQQHLHQQQHQQQLYNNRSFQNVPYSLDNQNQQFPSYFQLPQHQQQHQQQQQQQTEPSTAAAAAQEAQIESSFAGLSFSQNTANGFSSSTLGLGSSGLTTYRSVTGADGLFDAASQSREQVILNRLCDDTYVPTQPWPVDSEADAHFCRLVAEQIQTFGGNSTISKLRGTLKHILGTQGNIKSVPLKALLAAYPHMFHVSGNFVAAVPTQPTNTGAVLSTDTALGSVSS